VINSSGLAVVAVVALLPFVVDDVVDVVVPVHADMDTIRHKTVIRTNIFFINARSSFFVFLRDPDRGNEPAPPFDIISQCMCNPELPCILVAFGQS
jgi:hypothetical protein